jgi:FtsZ-interacting cell division protein YlmF
MASMWQKTLFYLGLVDEDEAPAYESPARAHAEYPYEDQEAGAPQARSEPQRRMTPDPRTARRTSQTPTPGGEIEHPDPIGTGVSGRRVEPPLTTRRRMPADNALAEAGVIIRGSDTPSVRTLSDADLQTQIIVARSYSDAQALADHIRAAAPVVLDLRKVEPAMVRRLVDFSSGLTYALGGSMRKVGQGVILVTPANVNITRDERARLADMGYYQESED